MSHIRSLAGGYKENSPRVRSENSKKTFVDNRPKTIDAQKLSNDIKQWASEGKLTPEDIQLIISELQKL
jgi:hypothetical protein